jgi:hypothetical protein
MTTALPDRFPRPGYDAVLDRRPALRPVAGIVEYEFGGTWVQLIGGRIETVPDVISFFDFLAPDGNALSCYQVLEEA